MSINFNGLCIIHCGKRGGKQKTFVQCRRYSDKLFWWLISQISWAEKPSQIAWMSLPRLQHSLKHDTVWQTSNRLKVNIPKVIKDAFPKLKAACSVKLLVFFNIVASHCKYNIHFYLAVNTREASPYSCGNYLHNWTTVGEGLFHRERSRTFIISSSPCSQALQSAQKISSSVDILHKEK